MLLTPLAYITVPVIVIGLVLSLVIGFSPSPQEKLRTKLIVTGVLFTIGLAILNAISLFVSTTSEEHRRALPSEVSAQFGLVAGEAYPFIIGDRIEGSTGEGFIRSGLFTTRGGFTIQPGSAVSVGFQHEANSYILELPMSGLTFVQDEDAEPSIVVYLQEDRRQAIQGSAVTATYGPCEYKLQDFLWMCHKEQLTTDYSLEQSLIRGGLAPIVADTFQSATITLTPEMYAQLLG